jgi:hypothetical protein
MGFSNLSSKQNTIQNIQECVEMENFLIIKFSNEILVFEEISLEKFKKQKDTSFQFSSLNNTPIAKFNPNKNGIQNAVFFCNMLQQINL